MPFLNLQGSQGRHKQLWREIMWYVITLPNCVQHIFILLIRVSLPVFPPIGGKVWIAVLPIHNPFPLCWLVLFSVFISLVVYLLSLFTRSRSFPFISSFTCSKYKLYHKFAFQVQISCSRSFYWINMYNEYNICNKGMMFRFYIYLLMYLLFI